jgi:hypothetical protein
MGQEFLSCLAWTVRDMPILRSEPGKETTGVWCVRKKASPILFCPARRGHDARQWFNSPS